MLIVCGTSASSLLVEKMDVVNAALCLTGNDAPGPQSEIIARNATIFFARVFHARERVAESIIGFSSLNVTRSIFMRDEIVVRSRFPLNARKSLPRSHTELETHCRNALSWLRLLI